MLTKSASGPLMLVVLTGMLLTGCLRGETSATEAAICEELRRDLPTYSRSDTPETLESGADFLDVFRAVCR